MLRKSFHDELKDLENDVLMMGRITRQAVENAVKVVVDCDIELADEVIAIDDRVDKLNYEIEEHATEIVARQAPVAKDLRFCWTALFVALHLERMADLAVNIAKGVKRACPIGAVTPILEHLNEMGQQTLLLIDVCLKAFEEKDLGLAGKLIEMDDIVDRMHKNMFEQLSRYQGDQSMDWIGSIVLASRYLERIADHCVDIAERINYLVTGEIPDGRLSR
ncbi:MAG: phosphate signaling complex protein PhoU [Actinomycetota bacterium]|nr:phosphate signaling complex protein PhoU [Actinomycetota bacterium]